MDRRTFAATTGWLLAGCSTRAQTEGADGRLAVRWRKSGGRRDAGVHPLGIRAKRDSLLYVPKSAAAREGAAPLLVYLHGAGGSEQQGVNRMGPLAEEFGFLLLSPASQGGTWDAIVEGYGPDVVTLSRALELAYDAHPIDTGRVAVGGFSDGASYALGIGLANGQTFRHILAFSPGFIPPGAKAQGKPRIFMSHGTKDAILPIGNCSRRLAPQLKSAGYEVEYREFEGPHTVPREIAADAMKWFTG